MESEQVEKIAALARVRLDPRERQAFAQQLTAILAWFEELRGVDTEGIAPAAHPTELTGPVRTDVPAPWPEPRRIVEAAGRQRDGCFEVPRILEE